MARILVASNYHLPLDPHAVAEMKPYPPLGTVVIATALRRAGHDAALWDATFCRDPGDFARGLDAHRPAAVLLVADHHAVLQKMCLTEQRQAAFTMIRLARQRGAEVIVTGPDATDQPGLYLDAGATAVLRGEPDEGLLRWAAGTPISEIAGVQQPGDPLASPAPGRDLNDLPLPDWSLVDLHAYSERWRARHGAWEAPVSAARGCPYRCSWCAKPIWGRSLALRPAAAVVADARALGALGADRVWFTDDIFALKRAWLREFRSAVEAAGGIPPYRCLSRVDLLVRDGTVDDLAATGCVEVWVGAESGSQRVLDAMQKDCRVEEIYEATRKLRARGIRVGFFLQLGYPGEKLEDVRRTVQMVRDLVPDEVGISVSYPLPGTAFYEEVKGRMTATNWRTAMDCKLLYEAEHPQAFYDAAREVIRREHALLAARGGVARVLSGRTSLRRALRRAIALPWHAARLPLHHLQLAWYARPRG